MTSLPTLIHPPPLPETFLFGVSISDHQSEAFDERFPPDVWDVWERHRGLVPRGRATDFWNRWEEDVRHAHRLGCRAFRFSIAWARVEPRPGEFDADALDHYRAIVQRLRELDIEPIVTLCHFVWPQHIEERGGLRSAQFAGWFAAYAAKVRAALEPHVRYWITFNEPNILLQGFYKLWFQTDFVFPPGHRPGVSVDNQIDVTIAVIRHLFEAHAAARRVLRDGEGHRHLVSANVFQLGLPSFAQSLIDLNVTRLKRAEDWRDQFWRMAERPTLFARRVDVVIAPVSPREIKHIQTSGFETVLFVTGLSALVKRDGDIRTLADLKGRRVAFVRGPGWEQVAAVQAHLNTSRMEFLDGHEQALALVEAGDAAAVIADHTILRGLAHLNPHYRVLHERFMHQAYAIAVENGHPTMNNAIQQAIRALQSEPGWIELCRHYFPACAERLAPPAFEPLPQAVPGSLLGHIQAHGRVVVGVQHAGVPWLDVLGSNTDHIGVEFDLGRALAGAIFGDSSQVEFRRATLPKRVTVGSRIHTHIRNRVDEWLRAWTIFSTFVSSSWWYMGMRGRLPGYLCPPSCVNQLDFVSFDYYFGMSAPTPGQIRRLALSMQRQFNRTALWAGGLHQALHYYHTLFPDLPILIAENGFAGEPFGEQRGEQLAAHVRAIQRAVAEGIDVRAYCVWSITSNREWGLPQEPASDFGLYYVDMDGDAELQRRETPSVDVYRKLIEGRGAS